MPIASMKKNCGKSPIEKVSSLDELRGLEGKAAEQYFSVFNDLILNQKEDFLFSTRNRRPPLDNVNAVLSFAYTILAGECANALYSVGLDPYVGFMHSDRPARISLALDLMEELRPILADRFVLTLISLTMTSRTRREWRILAKNFVYRPCLAPARLRPLALFFAKIHHTRSEISNQLFYECEGS